MHYKFQNIEIIAPIACVFRYHNAIISSLGATKYTKIHDHFSYHYYFKEESNILAYN